MAKQVLLGLFVLFSLNSLAFSDQKCKDSRFLKVIEAAANLRLEKAKDLFISDKTNQIIAVKTGSKTQDYNCIEEMLLSLQAVDKTESPLDHAFYPNDSAAGTMVNFIAQNLKAYDDDVIKMVMRYSSNSPTEIVFSLSTHKNPKLIDEIFTEKNIDLKNNELLRHHFFSELAIRDDVSTFQYFVEQKGLDPNPVFDGCSLFSNAVQLRSKKIVEYLLKQKIKNDAALCPDLIRGLFLREYSDELVISALEKITELTPQVAGSILAEGIFRKRIKVVNWLLSKGDFSKIEGEITYPLFYTIRQNNRTMYDLLLRAGFDYKTIDRDKNILSHISLTPKFFSLPELEEMLKNGVDPDRIEKNEYNEYYETTPLIQIVYSGNLDLIKLVLKYSKDPFKRTKSTSNGEDSILNAAIRSQYRQPSDQVFKYIFSFYEKNKKLTSEHTKDLLALAAASSLNDFKTLEFLYSKGIQNINEVSETTKCPPFVSAVQRANKGAMDFLRSKKASPHGLCSDDSNAFMFTSDKCWVTSYLYKLRVDPNQKNKQGAHPFLNYKTGKCLKEYLDSNSKVDLEIRDRNGSTVLQHLVGYDNLEALEYLLSKGVDVNIPDALGRTPLHYAASRNAFEVVEMLLAHGADPQRKDKYNQIAFDPQSLDYKKWVVTSNWRGKSQYSNFNTWLTKPDQHSSQEIEKKLINGMIYKVLVKKEKVELPASASDNMKRIYRFIDQAKKNPLSVDYEALEIEELDQAYYALIRATAPSDNALRFRKWLKSGAPAVNARQSAQIMEGMFDEYLAKNNFKLSSSAPDDFHAVYSKLILANKSPSKITANDFFISDQLPIKYVRFLLNAIQTLPGEKLRKFHLTEEQALILISKTLDQGKPDLADLQNIAWLMMIGRVGLDEKMIKKFKLSSANLREMQDLVTGQDPHKYKGASSFTGIKLIHALLQYSATDYECTEEDSDGGRTSNNPYISKLVTWFYQYGDHIDADKLFMSKLARLLIEKKKVCGQERVALLRAMNSWKSANALVQYEIVLAAHNGKKGSPNRFSDRLVLSQVLGARSELSQSAWLEQIRAIPSLKRQRNTNHEEGLEIWAGLLKFAFGQPQLEVDVEFSGQSETRKIKIPSADLKPGTIVSLCYLSNEAEKDLEYPIRDTDYLLGAKLFLQRLKQSLTHARHFPVNTRPLHKNEQTLKEDLLALGLHDDLQAIESECKILPNKDKRKQKDLTQYEDNEAALVKTKVDRYDYKKPPTLTKTKRKKRRSGDFDPRGR